MPLTGLQHQQFHAALLDAFAEAELRRMVKFELNVNLDEIAGGQHLSERVYNLVAWADAHDLLVDLLAGALRHNATNTTLLALSVAAKEWHMEPPAPAEQSPYKGLEFYDVGDAGLFFGREALTSELLDYLVSRRFLAVVGASGSGKSSLIRAGVVAQLKQGKQIEDSGNWAIHVIKPDYHPLKSLAVALTQDVESVTALATLMDDMRRDTRSLDLFASRLQAKTRSPRLLIVVDQFEELFSLCKDPAEQQAFVDNLVVAATEQGTLTIVLTLRADFYAHCAQFDNLRIALQNCQRYIGRMTQEEQRRAIELPAAQGGWELELGLTDLLLRDVADQPGALPLLSHALLETWNRRSGRTLTMKGYQTSGGVEGAIAHTADHLYNQLSPEQQSTVRKVFVRLTALGEGVQDTRRRAPLDELVDETRSAQIEDVLKRLADARLVVAEVERTDGTESRNRVYFEVTHEALIRQWPLLRRWLDEDREGLRIHRRLTDAASEWELLRYDPGSLFRGSVLAQTSEWAKTHRDYLNDEESAFLHASLQQQARSRLVLRGLGISVVLLLFVAFVAAALAYTATKQRLDDLRAEELLVQGNDKRLHLDVPGAVASFNAAAAASAARGKTLDISQEISDTLRYVALRYVHEAERILCEESRKPKSCPAPPTDAITETSLPDVSIDSTYLAWAKETAPMLTDWQSLQTQASQQSVLSATALFSQALALNPPPDTPVYVWIPPTTFGMGSTDQQCEKIGLSPCTQHEQPWHEVHLGGYWMQRTEVTNEQYQRCVDAGGCPSDPSNPFWRLLRSATLPVTHVDWTQASTYAAWVGGRLPTEAEWENACRGSDTRIYPWGDDLPSTELLNFGVQVGSTTSVGTYPRGAYGLYDMAGNVWEWTADWYQDDYYSITPPANPNGPQMGDKRVLRGGSWYSFFDRVHCAGRDSFRPTLGDGNTVGFRVVAPGP